MSENLACAVEAVLVLGRLQPLHAGFDDVDGRVAVDGGGARDGAEQSRPQLGNFLVLVVTAVEILQSEENPEPDGLIRPLLDDRGTQAFVATGQTLRLDDRPDAVEETLRVFQSIFNTGGGGVKWGTLLSAGIVYSEMYIFIKNKSKLPTFSSISSKKLGDLSYPR